MAEEEDQQQKLKVRLKFKFIYNESPYLLPQGYRLATLQEFRNSFDIIRKWGPPVEGTKRSSKEGSLYARLLDGFIQGYNNFDEFRENNSSYRVCEWIVAVKKKEWDIDLKKWRNLSAFYSSNGNLLRRQLYDGVTLDRARGIRIAWCNAYYFEDVELLYWLWKNHTLPSDREFDNFTSHVDSPLRKAMEHLRSSAHIFHPQMEILREIASTVLNYVKGKGTSDWGVAMVEFHIEVYGSDFVEKAAAITFTNVESIPIFTKLLSLSLHQLQDQIPNIKPRFAEVLSEAFQRKYDLLVDDMLLKFRDDIAHITTDDCVPALRAAFRGGYDELVKSFLPRDLVKLPVEEEDRGKTLFHYALFHPQVFELLQQAYANSDDNVITTQDIFGRNFLHWAAKGACESNVVYDILKESISSDNRRILCHQRDDRGRTPLHVAAFKGNSRMIEKLLDYFPDEDRTKWIHATDSCGQTALQLAAIEGHDHSVKMLLKKGSQPLKRDGQKKTALHRAAVVKDPKLALATCKALVESTKPHHKSLLLWASATGVGTADEMDGVDCDVKNYLLRQKKQYGEDLLKKAALIDNAEMAWELLNRGADMADILDPVWRGTLNPSEEKALKNVISHMDRMKEQGQDQPSMEDKLGRHVFAEGVAALLFNPFVESPITVGISGEWGMGKSSLMIQIEKILLITAAQLTFPILLPSEHFGGAKKISLSTRGRQIYGQIKKGFHNLLSTDISKNPVGTVLAKYQSQYHAIYKSLACMDNNQMLDSKSVSQQQQEHALREVPRILTIRYNAWQYRGRHEAWAGLGVTITKEIENAMTRAQWMSTCWRYTWAKHRVNIWIQIFLPCLLSISLALWVAWIIWMLLKQAKFQGLKYGSIPFTVIAITWVVLKSVISVVKPVSTQMLGYINSPGHVSHLGYQEDVIADINFLKKELGSKPHWFFSFILGVWCWNWFGLYADVIANTRIPKFVLASGDRIRIVTFVDDLDRCEEEVILQVLSAVNLVLAECKINAILGIDKKMIGRAIRRKFEDLDDADIAEKFISKVIQIPLSLPDPTEEETNRFLEYHLGHKSPDIRKQTVFGRPRRIAMTLEPSTGNNASQHSSLDIEEEHATQLGSLDIEEEDATQLGSLDIEEQHATQHIQREISKNPIKLFGCLFKCVYTVACNLPSELRQPYEEESCKLLRSAEGVRLIAELLLSNYTEEEANIFYELSKFASGNQKLPREWKRLLSYHKFAWYVVLRIGNVYSLPTWKEELIAWIFVCWQWKYEMNHLIKNWHKYTTNQNNDGRQRYCRGPRLSEIVAKIVAEPMEQSKISQKGEIVAEPMNKFKFLQSLATEGNNKGLKMKLEGPLKQDPSILCLYKDDEIIDEGTPKNNWAKLQEALKIRDVSMEAIQLFQQFRLHCETNHLPWDVHGFDMSNS